MYQYRIFGQFTQILKRILGAIILLVAFFAGVELFRVFLLLRRAEPWVMYSVLGATAFVIILLSLRIVFYNREHRILEARGYKIRGSSSHAELKKYVRYLIRYCKRLSAHRLLNDQQASFIQQKAHDLQDIFGHHPLNDDLTRAITSARDNIIAPTFNHLHVIGDKVTASKARAAIQDLYQPPFPVLPPLVVFYHQITLISEITDVYISRPSLREYIRVISDVWQVMTKGDFLRYGQRLFSGINSNAYSVGRAGDDLGQAFSIIWLTHAVAQAAVLRCCTLHDWTLSDAISDMNHQTIPCLEKTRDMLFNEALPILKQRIRHYTPVDRDPNQFVEDITIAFVKSVDSVVLALSTAAKSAPAEKTSAGLIHHPHAETLGTIVESAANVVDQGESGSRRHRRRRRHRRSSPSPMSSLIQRIIYMGKPPR
jgi:hypothetical protein